VTVSLRTGVAWNISGTVTATLCQFAAIPVLVHHLGLRGMGVVAFSWLVTAIAGALEMGLAPALSGELARRRNEPGASPPDRRLVRAFEIPSWVIATVIATIMAVGGTWIAQHWLSLEATDTGSFEAVRMMGLVAGLTLPMSLYINGLLGVERHRSANLTRIITNVVQHGGGALVVIWFPDPRAWLITAVVAQAAGVLLGRTLLLRSLAPGHGVDWAGLHARRVFVGGLGGIGLLSALIASLDRAVVSRLLPLEIFAAYSLAAMVGNGFRLLATPVFGALFPRLTALMSAGDETGAARLYVTASRWMAVFFAPAVAVVVVAAEPLLEIWCRNHELARQAALAAGLLAAGSALNALTTVPYALQLSVRWTRPGLISASSCLFITAAVVAVGAPMFGATGAALAWPVANVLAMAIVVPMTHRRVLAGISVAWHIAIIIPIMTTALVTYAAISVLPDLHSNVFGAVILGMACFTVSAVMAWHLGHQDRNGHKPERAT
jgi:O-antigen/teichoic acid export membrane protein